MKYIAKPFKPRDVTAANRSGYPKPYRAMVLPRFKRAIGDASGLRTVGINHTTLMPGKYSSMRHWHTKEDELIYVLEGEVVLITDQGERRMRAGQCVGFPARLRNGHHFVNRTKRPAVYLEISNRDHADSAYYPDVDMRWNAPGARGRYTRKDGSRF